nr:unnamed protein product [Spirometra erinaceieuropaei]
MQLRWSGHLVRMDDKRLPKRLFYGDVATGSCRQGGQIRRYKDTPKSSLKCLQINPTNWEEFSLDRPTWRRTVKTGAAIYEANRIVAPKAKREARKSQIRPVSNAAAQPLSTCPRCQRTFRARIGLVGHLRINCTSRTVPTIVPPPAPSSSSPPPTNPDNSSDPALPSSSSSFLFFFFSSSSSSPTAPTATAQATVPGPKTEFHLTTMISQRVSSGARILSSVLPRRNASALANLQSIISKELEGVKAAGTWKTERVITSKQAADVTVAGSKTGVINFCANNYLGLASHPKVIEKAMECLKSHGAGMSSVRFICGTTDIHKELEEQIARFHGREDSILFPSCFDANGAIFEALLQPEDCVFDIDSVIFEPDNIPDTHANLLYTT